jgi:hypothetical protein
MQPLSSVFDLFRRFPRSAATRIEVGHREEGGFVETNRISPSERGYEFQFDLVEKILKRLDGFRTVTCCDMAGNVITLDNFRRRGPDGGLDLIIRIEAKTPQASQQIAGKVRKILSDL